MARTLADLPAFAAGFALIAMFWSAHVRWRAIRGDGRGGAMLLSLALVFLVLVYVYPLRLMATSLIEFARGAADPVVPPGDLGPLFPHYGAGLATMSATTALLFPRGARGRAGAPRAEARGQATIYAMLATIGLVSTLVSKVPDWAPFAPRVYVLPPLLIGVFVWRYDWTGARR